MKYLKMSAFVFLYLAVDFIISNFVGIIYSLVYFIISKGSGTSSITANSFETSFYKNSVFLTVISAMVVIPIYWFILWLRKQKLPDFCGFKRFRFHHVLLVTLIGIALVLPVDFIVTALSIDKLSPGTEQVFNRMFEGNSLPVLLLAIGIVGPILEEIIFRGLIFNELRKNIPISVAIVIQGLLFGAMHMNWTQFIYAAPLGLLFGLIYIWTKSIWSTILVHISFNSAGIILGQYFNEQALFNQFFIILNFIAIIMLMLLLWNSRNRSGNPIKIKLPQ